MEIPCKHTFMGPPTELQKVQKFFVSAFGIRVIFSFPMITDASVSSSLCSVTTTSSDSSPSKKCTLYTWGKNREFSQVKRVKCDESASESSSTATSFSISSPPAEDYTEGDAANKHVKCITVNDSESSSAVNSTKVWVRFRHSSLTLEDKCKIEDGSRLTDKHINFANSLISCQFPHIGGLRSTLQNRYYCFPLQSIQPIFCKG